MIQRIQTLFLAMVVIAMSIFLFVTIWQKSNDITNEVVTLNAFSMIQMRNGQLIYEQTSIWLAVLAIIAVIISTFSIFSFKKRLFQLQLGLINSVLIAATLGLIIYFSFKGEALMPNTARGSYGPGLLIPAIALVLNNIANRFIRKDEEEVRSADRIR